MIDTSTTVSNGSEENVTDSQVSEALERFEQLWNTHDFEINMHFGSGGESATKIKQFLTQELTTIAHRSGEVTENTSLKKGK